MKNLKMLLCVLTLALLVAPIAFADEPEAAVPTDNPMVLDWAGAASSCDGGAEANFTPAEPIEARLEETLDGTHDARDLALCWPESSTNYQCTCFSNTRFRKIVSERTCCDNGWCSGWSQVSSSCTQYAC